MLYAIDKDVSASKLRHVNDLLKLTFNGNSETVLSCPFQNRFQLCSTLNIKEITPK